MDSKNLLSGIMQMFNGAESTVKMLNTLDGFDLTEEQKEQVRKKLKDEGLIEKANVGMSEVKKKMNELNNSFKKFNSQNKNASH